MAGKKYRLTGFTRFFVVMIILAPIFYIGASYYNGEDGIENIKNLIGINKEKTEVVISDEPVTDAKDLQARIQELEKENATLKAKIQELERQK